MPEQLTLLTAAVVVRWWQRRPCTKLGDLPDRCEGHLTQSLVEDDRPPPPQTSVPDKAPPDAALQHLLETQGNCAELHVSRHTVATPHLDLARHQLSVRVTLDDVGTACETQLLRPHGHRPRHDATAFPSTPRVVRPPVTPASANGMSVLFPYAVDQD